MTTDSRPETLKHIVKVMNLLEEVVDELHLRAKYHDKSKLASPEVEVFDEFTDRLADSEYGSDEYNANLEAMKPALDHHYVANRHHPQHWINGIRGMSLIDLIEMLADWKAATLRNKNGNLAESIIQNAERFEYDDHMVNLLLETARDMGWL